VGSGPAQASAQPSASLTIGILNDPATVLGATMWAILELTRIMQLADQVSEHFKEDVRRARDPQPQRAPRVVPVPLPDLPELTPVPMRAPPYRAARPAPITDTLPAKATS
jgi:hypothetical protein